MIARRTLAWLLILPCCTAALAQRGYDPYANQEDPYADPPRNDANYDEVPVLFFTPKLVDLAINRLTDEMGSHYGFSDDQLLQAREAIKTRFPEWLQQNKRELVTLANEYMEGVIGDQPPTAEQVADWSARAMPLFNEFTTLVEDTTDEMQVFMTDEQRTQLNGEMAAFRVGTTYMQARMDDWSRGNYNWETEWPRSKKFQENENQRTQQVEHDAREARRLAMGIEAGIDGGGALGAGQPGAALPGDANNPDNGPATAGGPAAPTDEWDRYAQEFIRKYGLTKAQQDQVQRVVGPIKKERDLFLAGSLNTIRKLQDRLEKAETEEEKAQIRESYERITGGVDRIFDKLKARLNAIPTSKQRMEAAQREVRATPEKPTTH